MVEPHQLQADVFRDVVGALVPVFIQNVLDVSVCSRFADADEPGNLAVWAASTAMGSA
jgi:hypothetical protein